MRAVIFGVASEDSIAWHIARGMHLAGAAIHLGYQQRFRSRVLQLLNTSDVTPESAQRCDVMEPRALEEFLGAIGAPIDVVVHSIASAPAESFAKPIQDLELDEFAQTIAVSAYSLLRVVRVALPLLSSQASVLTMSYVGAQRVVPGYRVMGVAKAALESVVRELAVELGPRGVRVNAISAGPIRTLSSQAVPGFLDLLAAYAEIVPLRTTVEPRDVADLAVFLSSTSARCITGQVMFVDAGFSILGVAR
jgi:enoyl-[acyl-carrier protein] reductase I